MDDENAQGTLLLRSDADEDQRNGRNPAAFADEVVQLPLIIGDA
jgi:hypothetical protein